MTDGADLDGVEFTLSERVRRFCKTLYMVAVPFSKHRCAVFLL